MRSHRLTEENPRTVLVPEEKALLEEKAESRAKISSNESVRTRRVIIGTLPYVEITSLRLGCIYDNDCCSRHFEAEEKPSKKSKKGGAKGSVALLMESLQLGCVSQDSHPRKSVLREENWDQITPSKFLQGHATPQQNSGNEEDPSQGIFQKSENLKNAIRAFPDLRKEHKTKPCNKKDAPAE